ncbi:CAP domain-containing protein [Naematelia encephala]|uniref:CAP domain-containing protein n=1 Tax=Naematelia encephala TaxID=71784 RepID=A0A1Y2BJB3_9TREE|nr:CAP domain-containing protein [Naematelia encephala]
MLTIRLLTLLPFLATVLQPGSALPQRGLQFDAEADTNAKTAASSEADKALTISHIPSPSRYKSIKLASRSIPTSGPTEDIDATNTLSTSKDIDDLDGLGETLLEERQGLCVLGDCWSSSLDAPSAPDATNTPSTSKDTDDSDDLSINLLEDREMSNSEGLSPTLSSNDTDDSDGLGESIHCQPPFCFSSSLDAPSDPDATNTLSTSKDTDVSDKNLLEDRSTLCTWWPIKIGCSSLLDQHNGLRQQYGANALTWSNDLQESAQATAATCKFTHTNNNTIGENFALISGPEANFTTAFELWASEAASYNPKEPVYNADYANFTQLVWFSTDQVGCGVANCSEGIETSGWTAGGGLWFYVCHYLEAGNVAGEFSKGVPFNF